MSRLLRFFPHGDGISAEIHFPRVGAAVLTVLFDGPGEVIDPIVRKSADGLFPLYIRFHYASQSLAQPFFVILVPGKHHAVGLVFEVAINGMAYEILSKRLHIAVFEIFLLIFFAKALEIILQLCRQMVEQFLFCRRFPLLFRQFAFFHWDSSCYPVNADFSYDTQADNGAYSYVMCSVRSFFLQIFPYSSYSYS